MDDLTLEQLEELRAMIAPAGSFSRAADIRADEAREAASAGSYLELAAAVGLVLFRIFLEREIAAKRELQQLTDPQPAPVKPA